MFKFHKHNWRNLANGYESITFGCVTCGKLLDLFDAQASSKFGPEDRWPDRATKEEVGIIYRVRRSNR